MHLELNKFIKELEYASPGFLNKIESLYPLQFNIGISSLPKTSISLNREIQTFNFWQHANPNFSLNLDIFTALNALQNKQIPTKCISGDAEAAVILLGAVANIKIDMELMIYKYFGDIPALILRKIISTHDQSLGSSEDSDNARMLLQSFRDISIRLDRLEHTLST